MEILRNLGRFLYIIHPGTTFEKVEDIPSPNFIQQVNISLIRRYVIENLKQIFTMF